ncbi:MAG: protein translocase subunit SecD [Acidimicrobiia bacterium]|nr:protein translocase subunit SecD [Acidimicrobiia bacterium]
MTAWQEGRPTDAEPQQTTRSRRLISVLVMILLGWGGLAAVFATDTTPKLGLDLAGGTSVILRAPSGTSSEQLDQAVNVMRKRIEALGNVQEPVIQVAGNNNIVVQLPGVTDRERALEAIGSTGQLSFRAVINDGLLGPLDEPIDPSDDDPTQPATLANIDPLEGPLLVDGAFAVGADIADASALFSGFEWVVSLDFTRAGDDKFTAATRLAASFAPGDPRRRFAIVLDGTVISAPQVAATVDPAVGISGGAQITLGGAADPEQEARDLEIVLKFGALPIVLEREQVQFVSASLGRDSLNAGLVAGFGGLALVAVAMLFYYRVLGLVTVLGLSIFGSLVIGAYSVLGTSQGLTLTLAGVAGIIVSVGITSDSYIVYFERIKEEIRHGRTVDDAVEEGFSRAFKTILTADTVSFTGAILLWFLALGPVKGFALALGLATLIDVFVAYFFTRNAVALLVGTRLGDGGAFSIRGTTGRERTT